MNDGSATGSLLLLLLPLVLIGFLLWSTRRRQRTMAQFSQSLQVGDEVVLTSGIYGTVRALDETSAQLEVARGTVITVDRRAVGARAADLAGGPAEPSPADGTTAEERD